MYISVVYFAISESSRPPRRASSPALRHIIHIAFGANLINYTRHVYSIEMASNQFDLDTATNRTIFTHRSHTVFHILTVLPFMYGVDVGWRHQPPTQYAWLLTSRSSACSSACDDDGFDVGVMYGFVSVCVCTYALVRLLVILLLIRWLTQIHRHTHSLRSIRPIWL